MATKLTRTMLQALREIDAAHSGQREWRRRISSNTLFALISRKLVRDTSSDPFWQDYAPTEAGCAALKEQSK